MEENKDDLKESKAMEELTQSAANDEAGNSDKANNLSKDPKSSENFENDDQDSSFEPTDIDITVDETNSTLNNFETSDFFNSKGELILPTAISPWTSDDESSLSELQLLDIPNDDTEADLSALSLPHLPIFPVAEFHAAQNNQSVVPASAIRYTAPNYGVRMSPSLSYQVVDLLQPTTTSGWAVPKEFANHPQITTRAPNFRTPGGYKPKKNPDPPRNLTENELLEEVKLMYSEDAIEDNENNGDPSSSSKSNDSNNSDDDNIKELENQVQAFPSIYERKENMPFVSTEKDKPVKRKLFQKGENCGNDVGSIPDLNIGVRDLTDMEVREPRMTKSKAWICGSEQEKCKRSSSSGGRSSGRRRRNNNRRNSLSDAQDTTSSPGGFSFGYGEKESPIKAVAALTQLHSHGDGGGDRNKLSVDKERRKQFLPSTVIAEDRSAANNLSSSSYLPSPCNVKLADLDRLWKDIQETKAKLDQDIERNETGRLKSNKKAAAPVSDHSVSSLNSESKKSKEKVDKTRATNISDQMMERRNIAASPSRNQNTAPSISHNALGPHQFSSQMTAPGTNSQIVYESELDKILKETNFNADEFEDLISRIESRGDGISSISEILKMDAARGGEAATELEAAFSRIQISSDIRGGGEPAMGHFDHLNSQKALHAEKIRREQCEMEIANLQKLVLELKQKLAVSEGNMKKKDETLVRIALSWNRKNLECAETVQGLQDKYEDLMNSAKENSARIVAYEKQLMETQEVTGKFKSKVKALEEEKDAMKASTGTELKRRDGRISELEARLMLMQVIISVHPLCI